MEFLRAHALCAFVACSILNSLSVAVSLHETTLDEKSHLSAASEHSRRERPTDAISEIRGHLDGRGVYIADHHSINMGNEQHVNVAEHHKSKMLHESDSSESSSMTLDASGKISDSSNHLGGKAQPSFMRRELELGGNDEEDAILDEWPEMEPYSLSELSSSSDAKLDESHNWWDRRRRRRAIDCKWTEWGAWTACSVTCGAGQKKMSRQTVGPHWGGVGCVTGDKERFSTCNTQNCPVSCEWNHWGPWGPCTKTCGVGIKHRKRGALPFTDRDGGSHCPESGKEDSSQCSTFSCPINCDVGAWGLWGSCSKTCGTGVKKRIRQGNGPFHGGAPCPGLLEHEEKCNGFACPIDCSWGAWGAWGQCSKTCGGGLKLKQRSYLPMAHNGGKACPGSPAELLACNIEECPVDCVWAPWHDPSPCTKTCGGGSFKRHRSRLQEVAFGGKTCDGEPSTEIGPCNVEPCAVDCQYDEWSMWTECSESCGGGTKTAKRNSTFPEHGGMECSEANSTKEDKCNDVPCPGVMVEGGAQHRTASVVALISAFFVQASMSSVI